MCVRHRALSFPLESARRVWPLATSCHDTMIHHLSREIRLPLQQKGSASGERESDVIDKPTNRAAEKPWTAVHAPAEVCSSMAANETPTPGWRAETMAPTLRASDASLISDKWRTKRRGNALSPGSGGTQRQRIKSQNQSKRIVHDPLEPRRQAWAKQHSC